MAYGDYVIIGVADNRYSDCYCVIGTVRNGIEKDKEICKEGIISILKMKECYVDDDTQFFVVPMREERDIERFVGKIIDKIEPDDMRIIVYEYKGLIDGRAKGMVYAGTDWVISHIGA